MRQFQDQMGRRLIVSGVPKRIVSLVPSQTEFLSALGLEEEVVGITKFCIYPDAWFQEKTRVGGTKKVKMDIVRALNPDLIIGNKEENTKEDIALLSAEFPVWMSDVNSLEDAYSMMMSVGEICGKVVESENLVQQIKENLKQVKGIGKGKKVLYFIWHDPDFVVGKETYIDSMLTFLGYENECKVGRYPELQALESYEPDYVLLSSEPFPFSAQHVIYFQNLFPKAEIKFVDGELFSWYGSRMKEINSKALFVEK